MQQSQERMCHSHPSTYFLKFDEEDVLGKYSSYCTNIAERMVKARHLMHFHAL